LDLHKALQLVNQAKERQDEKTQIYIKPQQMRLVSENITERPYTRCLGSLTTTVLEADLNLYLCSNQKCPEFCYGNLTENSFRSSWLSDRRQQILNQLKVNNCPAACRMDPLNRIYDKVIKGNLAIPAQQLHPRPEDHVNFL
jgi:radical SAM protein with 4Fe4S-binding SPASM domain